MGVGATKGSEPGVPINPLLHYTDYRSQNEKKDLVMDAPVLVKLEQGTVRYRYNEDEHSHQDKNDRKEKFTHEGQEKAKKHGYFFHTSLNRFGPDADQKNEADYKFAYVYKGPAKAKQKKIYYVFGKGLKTNDHGFIEPRKFNAIDAYKGPTAYKEHGHVYFDLIFVKQDEELCENVNEEGDVDEHGIESIIVVLSDKDDIEKVQWTVAIRMMKPSNHIHVFHYGKELRLDDVVSCLRQPPDGTWHRFRVLLKPK